MDHSYFPITIRGKDYLVLQKGDLIEIVYDCDNHKDDEFVPDEEADLVIMYLIDEGFIK